MGIEFDELCWRILEMTMPGVRAHERTAAHPGLDAGARAGGAAGRRRCVNGWIGAEHWPLRTLRVQGRVAARGRAAPARDGAAVCVRKGFLRGATSATRRRPSRACRGWSAPKCASAGPTCWKCASSNTVRSRAGASDRLSVRARPAVPGAGRADAGRPAAARRTGCARRRRGRALQRIARAVRAQRHRRARAWRWIRAAAGRWSCPTAPRSSSAAATRACAWRRFARLLPQLLSQKQLPLTRADLRYTNGFALQLAGALHAGTSAARAAIAGKDMNRKGDKALIVGLDIGTSKVVALVGEYSPGNPIEVIGIGSHESRGSSAAWWSTSSRPCSRSSARSRKPS